MAGVASNAYYIRKLGAEGAGRLVSVVARDVIVQATAAVAGEQQRILTAFSAALQNKFARNRDTRLTNLHYDVASDAQRAVIGAYNERIGTGHLGGYRADEPEGSKFKRYANGAMVDALSDPEFFRASWDGILFINTGILDRKAKQWYRLNFGAGARGSSGFTHPEYRMRFFGSALPTPLTLGGFTPSKPYLLPTGFFGEPGSIVGPDAARRGQDPFYPVRYFGAEGKHIGEGVPVRRKTSLGHPGKAFLDVGVGQMARTLPAGYTALIGEWFREAAVQQTGPISFVIGAENVKAGLPVIEAQMAKLAAASTVTGRFLSQGFRPGRF